MNIAILYQNKPYFNYDLNWEPAFTSRRDIKADFVELAFSNALTILKAILSYECIVLLPSVDPAYYFYGSRKENIFKLLRYRRGKLVFLPRNEYFKFPHRRKFIKDAHVDLVASQMPVEGAKYLYSDLTDTISLPPAMDIGHFAPMQDFDKRPIMIGGRTTHAASATLLDNSRNRLIVLLERIKGLSPNWTIDYSNKHEDKFTRNEWVRFLNRCKFTLSTQSGARYLDKTDVLYDLIKQYIAKHNVIQHPDVPLEQFRQITEHFRDRTKDLPSGKCIAPRHFEAIACKTCQILVEGEYNGLLKPDKHYIELKADHSNLDQVLEKMQNQRLVDRIIEETYSYCRGNHTYEHRVEYLLEEIQGL